MEYAAVYFSLFYISRIILLILDARRANLIAVNIGTRDFDLVRFLWNRGQEHASTMSALHKRRQLLLIIHICLDKSSPFLHSLISIPYQDS